MSIPPSGPGGGPAPPRRRGGRPGAVLLGLALLCAAGVTAGSERAAFSVLGLPVSDAGTREVVEHPSLLRRLKPVPVPGTQSVIDWLLDRPPLAATLARHLYPQLERYHVTAAGDGTYTVDDGGALRGHLRLIAQGPARRVYFCDGQFRSLAHILKLSGRMVFTLEYRELAEEGKTHVEVSPQLFVRLDNVVVHGILKVIGPLLDGIIDRRVANLTAAAQIVTRRLQEDPRGLYQEMRTWPEVTPQEREEFRLAFRIPTEHP